MQTSTLLPEPHLCLLSERRAWTACKHPQTHVLYIRHFNSQPPTTSHLMLLHPQHQVLPIGWQVCLQMMMLCQETYS